MRLPLGFAHDRQHVALGFGSDASRFGCRLAEQLATGGPGVTTKRFGVGARLFAHRLDLGCGLGSPSGGIGGGSVSHRLRRLARRLEHGSHFPPQVVELRLEIPVRKVPDLGLQPLLLLGEVCDPIGHPVEEFGHLRRVEPASDGAEAGQANLLGGDIGSHCA